jgi:hypothetical protein
MKVIFFTILLFVLMPVNKLLAQTKEIYTNPSFDSFAKEHKTLAILPFEVTLRRRPKEMEKLEPEDLEIIQKHEGEAVQNALYTYFLNQKEEQDFKVKFQDVGTTNLWLLKKKWNLDSLKRRTKKELADSLEVDGIISGFLYTRKPMSEASSVAVTFFTDLWVFPGVGATNSGKCTINVHDGASGELLWRYEKTLSRGLGSDTQTVINAMMRKASRKFPYEGIK